MEVVCSVKIHIRQFQGVDPVDFLNMFDQDLKHVDWVSDQFVPEVCQRRYQFKFAWNEVELALFDYGLHFFQLLLAVNIWNITQKSVFFLEVNIQNILSYTKLFRGYQQSDIDANCWPKLDLQLHVKCGVFCHKSFLSIDEILSCFYSFFGILFRLRQILKDLSFSGPFIFEVFFPLISDRFAMRAMSSPVHFLMLRFAVEGFFTFSAHEFS